jgi:hypothetical protein
MPGKGIPPTNPYRKAGLPMRRGRFRFLPIPGANPHNPPRGRQHGYLDRFGNEWVQGPPHHFPEDDFEWDVQCGGNHVNVSKHGIIRV